MKTTEVLNVLFRHPPNVFDFGANTDIWRFERLFPDNGSERNFWCGQFGRNSRPRQDLVRTQVRRVATPGKAAAVMSYESFAESEEFPGLAVLKGGEPSRFNDDRSKLEHLILSLAYVLVYSLYGIRSRLGELRLALGIMPSAETEPTGQAGPSKPAKPFANPLMTKFLAVTVSGKTLSLWTICSIRQNKIENTAHPPKRKSVPEVGVVSRCNAQRTLKWLQ
jgi:hypothetical protein